MPHVHDRFERFFTTKVLFAAVAALAVAFETAGGGAFFHDTGLVHVPGVLFALLVAVRILAHYRINDPVLRTFHRSGLAALGVLLAAHAAEFVQQDVALRAPAAPAYVIVVSLHVLALLILLAGILHILSTARGAGHALDWYAMIGVGGVGALVALVSAGAVDLDAIPPLSYVLLAMGVGSCAAAGTLALAKATPLLADFSRHMTAAVVFITVAAGMNALHLVAFGDDAVVRQATYLSNLSYLIALSSWFLGLGRYAVAGVGPRGTRAEPGASAPAKARRKAKRAA